MTDTEDRGKAEKLAAAKKRFEQLKKQKEKGKKSGSVKKKEDPQGSNAETTEAGASEETDVIEDLSLANANQQHTEPIPEPIPEPPENEKGASEGIDQDESNQMPTRQMHNRQPSLSLQSQLRSSSFRRTSVSQTQTSPPLNGGKSPTLPILSPDGDTVNEIYRKQTARIDELERENRRLSKDAKEGEARLKKTEEELEELRESSGEFAELKLKARGADAKSQEIEKLKHENTSLQRQLAQSQSQSSRSIRHASSPSQAQGSFPTSELQAQLDSKSSAVESMEMEISNLRSQLSKSISTHTSHQEQTTALEDKVDRAERAAGAAQRELLEARKNLDRASEKAVKEGSERISAETKIRSLERDTEESRKRAQDSLKRAEALEKKLAALTNLHKESDSRRQVVEREREKVEREATELRKRLAGLENENLRYREEKERLKKREASGVDDEGVDELEDEERRRLEDKVRELEGEVFDLRRGVWKEKRRDLGGVEGDDSPASPGSKFDEVDLTGGSPRFRRQSLIASRGQVFSNVLSSGFNALTGGGRQESHELLDGIDDGFDEDAFRVAQEEEADRRIERTKELKRALKGWEGWTMDIVDCRLAGGGFGEIFDV